MMKKLAIVLVALVYLTGLTVGADNPALPKTKSLKELPLQLVKDFSSNGEIASPALPVIAGEGNLFFYDYKLKRLSKANLEDDTVVAVGRYGEGPKEYTSITSLWADEKCVYAIDRKGKILCFDLDGVFQWEDRLDKAFPRFIGIQDGSVYFSNFSRFSSLVRTLRLFRWKKGQRAAQLMNLPVEFISTSSFHISGKLVKGGGIMDLAVPTIALWNGKLVTSAYEDYRFDLRDSTGKSKTQVKMAAPAPELNPRMRSFKGIDRKKKYALREIYPLKSSLAVVSNYYRDHKPRIDFFDNQGKLLHSYILPFKANGGGNDIVIRGDFIFHSVHGQVGFKVYKIALKM
jgi:hypothetical protein